MGLVTRIGQWLDKRFPEKVTAEDVNKRFRLYDEELAAIHQSIEAFDIRLASNRFDDIEKLKVDIEKLKALSVVKSKMAQPYQGNMSPNMQWPLPPVMPGPVSK